MLHHMIPRQHAPHLYFIIFYIIINGDGNDDDEQTRPRRHFIRYLFPFILPPKKDNSNDYH